MFFFLSQFVVLLLILLLLYLLSWFLPKDSPWSPWWATSTEVAKKAFRLAKVGKKDIVYELGSGTGTAMIVAAKAFNVQKAVGIETSASRVWWSQQKARRHNVIKQTTFLQKNFYDIDLSPASVVYLYLVPRVIKELQKKLLKDLKPGTRVVTYVYEIDYLPLCATDEAKKIFVYEIPRKKKSVL